MAISTLKDSGMGTTTLAIYINMCWMFITAGVPSYDLSARRAIPPKDLRCLTAQPSAVHVKLAIPGHAIVFLCFSFVSEMNSFRARV